MIKFEKVSRFKDVDLPAPTRKTAMSAGYDLAVAEDIVIYPYQYHKALMGETVGSIVMPIKSLDEIAQLTKGTNAKPTLVSTGMKCYLEPDTYLELSVRSSTPLKYWLIMANGVGIIDADYADNPNNEGEIFLQFINLSPYPIKLKKGDIVGQGIIKKYEITNDDAATGKRIGGFGSTTVEPKGWTEC